MKLCLNKLNNDKFYLHNNNIMFKIQIYKLFKKLIVINFFIILFMICSIILKKNFI